MRVSDAFPSQYLKSADLQGRTVKVTIDRYTIEDVGDDRKPVIYFVGKEKGLVLNKTNASEIAFAHGDDMDDWGGKEIELFSMMVSFQGKNMPGLRVRAIRSSNSAPAPARHVDAPLPAHVTQGPPILDDEIPFITCEWDENLLLRKRMVL